MTLALLFLGNERLLLSPRARIFSAIPEQIVVCLLRKNSYDYFIESQTYSWTWNADFL